MREFNIHEVSAGDELVCRDGKHTGKILCFHKGKMKVLIVGPELDGVLDYGLDGKNEYSHGNDFGHDLMLPDLEADGYVAIFRSLVDKDNEWVYYVHHEVFKTLEHAVTCADSPAYINKWELYKIQPVTGIEYAKTI